MQGYINNLNSERGIMEQENTLWMVVPCFNEEKRLDVSEFKSVMQVYPRMNICFVNDCSRDNTLSVLEGIVATFSDRMTIVNNSKNIGKAGSVRAGVLSGLDNSKCLFFGYWDADLATPFSELGGMLDLIINDDNISAVIGSRVNTLGRDIQRKKSRHYLGRVFATIASVILDASVYDTQCGAKIFSREFAKSVFTSELITNWCFDIEILMRFKSNPDDLKILNKTVIEYPLKKWFDVDGSKIKFRDYWSIGKDILKLFYLKSVK